VRVLLLLLLLRFCVIIIYCALSAQLIKRTSVRINVHTAGKHGVSKFRTVELGGTELGTLRTCARAPPARARAARHTTQSFITAIFIFIF
jgi:hypothetical protein